MRHGEQSKKNPYLHRTPFTNTSTGLYNIEDYLTSVRLSSNVAYNSTHVLVKVTPKVLGHVGTPVTIVNCREASIRRKEEFILHVWAVSLWESKKRTRDKDRMIMTSNEGTKQMRTTSS